MTHEHAAHLELMRRARELSHDSLVAATAHQAEHIASLERELAQERAKSEMLAGDAGRLVELLALHINVVEAAREWHGADGLPNHRRFFVACEKLHDAVAAFDAHRDGVKA